MVPEIWCMTDIIFVILDHFLSFYPTNNPKNKNFENWKKPWRCYYFTHVYDKLQSNDLCFLGDRVQWTESLIILDHFLPFYPNNNTKKEKF